MSLVKIKTEPIEANDGNSVRTFSREVSTIFCRTKLILSIYVFKQNDITIYSRMKLILKLFPPREKPEEFGNKMQIDRTKRFDFFSQTNRHFYTFKSSPTKPK